MISFFYKYKYKELRAIVSKLSIGQVQVVLTDDGLGDIASEVGELLQQNLDQGQCPSSLGKWKSHEISENVQKFIRRKYWNFIVYIILLTIQNIPSQLSTHFKIVLQVYVNVLLNLDLDGECTPYKDTEGLLSITTVMSYRDIPSPQKLKNCCQSRNPLNVKVKRAGRIVQKRHYGWDFYSTTCSKYREYHWRVTEGYISVLVSFFQIPREKIFMV